MTALFCASGALAMWIDVRLGNRGPSSLRSVVLFIVSGMIGLKLAKGVTVANLSSDDPTAAYAVLFGVLLPALVFLFLTTIWLLKVLRGAMLR